jgi:hypothetical protein
MDHAGSVLDGGVNSWTCRSSETVRKAVVFHPQTIDRLTIHEGNDGEISEDFTGFQGFNGRKKSTLAGDVPVCSEFVFGKKGHRNVLLETPAGNPRCTTFRLLILRAEPLVFFPKEKRVTCLHGAVDKKVGIE